MVKSNKTGPISGDSQRTTTVRPGKTPKRDPGCPEHFGKVAKKIWKALVQDLIEDGRLTSHTVPAFTAMIEARHMAEACREEMTFPGGAIQLTIDGAKGMRVQNPAFRTYKECMALFQSWAKEFALTPQSLVRLGVDLKPKGENKTEEFR